MVRWNLMRKGQAAMEFLMTYGWAILVVLAAIGALAYFGVLSPDRFLPDKCTANPPFSCTQYKISGGASPTIAFNLQNSAGVDMASVSVYLTCNTPSTSGSGLANWTNGGVLANGNPATITYTCANDNVLAGSRWKGNFSVVYQKSGETVTHTSTGVIQVRAE